MSIDDLLRIVPENKQNPRNGLEHAPQPSTMNWDRGPDRRHAQAIRNYERQQLAALRRGEKLLARKTTGGPERVLARMQQVSEAYTKYATALSAIIRLELL